MNDSQLNNPNNQSELNPFAKLKLKNLEKNSLISRNIETDRNNYNSINETIQQKQKKSNFVNEYEDWIQ